MTTTIPHLSKIVKAFKVEDVRLSELKETEQTGHPFIICTNIARWLKKEFFPQAKIMGYEFELNDTAEIGKYCDGHDFLVIDNRYIIELWFRYIEMEKGCPLILDMKTQPELVRKFYGDKKKWVKLKK